MGGVLEANFDANDILQHRPAYPELVSMPGVPSYDPLEQQLLASLERELGVL